MDNFELSNDSRNNIPLYHSMLPYMQEIAKCENHLSNDNVDHVHNTLSRLLGTAVNSISSSLCDNSENTQSNNAIKSLHPNHDTRKKDKRLKAYCEL